MILISATVLLSTVFLPYWLKEILILGSLGILALLLKKLLTGNNFFDFLILILLGTLGFYSIINFRYLFANPPAIAAELIYNVILGLITIFVVKNFFMKKRRELNLEDILADKAAVEDLLEVPVKPGVFKICFLVIALMVLINVNRLFL